ncbi:MAG: DUF962 domain-containing protein [Polyangiaceae bacterium]
MSERRIETYEEFWPFYVREHSDPTNRKLHFVGTSGTILLAALALVRGKPIHLLHAAISGYGGAWIGHFFFQKNKPATFKYPLWSLISDFRMYGKIVAGTMDDEVARAMEAYEREQQESAAPAPAPAEPAQGDAPEIRRQDLN